MRVLTTSLLLLAFAVVAVAADELPGFDPTWRSCSKDSGCILVRGVCEEPECVGERYQVQVSSYFDSQSPVQNCQNEALQQKVRAVCRDNHCECAEVHR